MNEQPISRNRLRGMYQENRASFEADHAQLRRRMLDLNLASLRNAIAIDNLMQRLQPALHASLEH